MYSGFSSIPQRIGYSKFLRLKLKYAIEGVEGKTISKQSVSKAKIKRISQKNFSVETARKLSLRFLKRFGKMELYKGLGSNIQIIIGKAQCKLKIDICQLESLNESREMTFLKQFNSAEKITSGWSSSSYPIVTKILLDLLLFLQQKGILTVNLHFWDVIEFDFRVNKGFIDRIQKHYADAKQLFSICSLNKANCIRFLRKIPSPKGSCAGQKVGNIELDWSWIQENRKHSNLKAFFWKHVGLPIRTISLKTL